MKSFFATLSVLLSQVTLMAQEATSATAPVAAAPQPSFLSMMMPFAIIMGIFYFLMIRPQKKKMEQETKFLNALKKGDEVYTRSGLIGTIYGMADKIVTLEVAEGMKLKVLKSQIAGDAKVLFSQDANNGNTTGTKKS